jgi:hypothetical protein
MDKSEQFKLFLESLKTDSNAETINTLIEGFALIESEDKKFEKTISVNFRNSDDSLKLILDLFKSGKHGILLIDPESDNDEVDAVRVRGEAWFGEDRRPIRSYDVKFTESEDEDDKTETCTIKITTDSKNNLDYAVNTFTKLFKLIAGYGNGGHSYVLKFIPNSNQAKSHVIGWDGDGSDFLDPDSIKIT